LAERLLEKRGVMVTNDEAHEREHALEVQLPFLQVVLGSFKLVPVIVGDQSPEVSIGLAESITALLKEGPARCLIVGSTDLSHYYPYAAAVEMDRKALRSLEAFDVEGMMRDHKDQKFEACGAGPMITTMLASRSLGATKSKVMKYMNSGDVSGDRSAVVGYVSTVFYRT
jgi:MEMO1 family protein